MLYRIGWISAEKKKRLLSPSGETHNKSYMQDSQFREGKSIQKEAKPVHTIYPFRGCPGNVLTGCCSKNVYKWEICAYWAKSPIIKWISDTI